MLNYFIPITLITLVLIAQNILLLNEETLILLCFVVFCWLALKNLTYSVTVDLDNRSNHIKRKLKDSLEKTTLSLEKFLNMQSRFWNLFFNFKLIGNNCIKFINSISDWSINHRIKLSKTSFSKRLQFISRIEKQTSKLISLLLIHKLNEITKLKYYYSCNFNHTYFPCLSKISTREYLQLIKK